MRIDAKTSKILSQAYLIVSCCFVLFALGLVGSLYIPIVLSSLISLIGVFPTIIMCCTQSPKLKVCLMSFSALTAGFGAGAFCISHGLDCSEIVFCALATTLAFVSTTIVSLLTTELTLLYTFMGIISSIVYIPLTIWYVFSWGLTAAYIFISVSVIMSILFLIIDTQSIIRAIEAGVDDPFILAWTLFVDAFDLFMYLAKLMIVMSKKRDDDK
ncbi:hypothetical protein ENUP19_0011G0046 [Entamoeba nuttalli]|uniref:Bax inhibitor, putative n=2 Tax=Entamoeba nuttalli TaxID=412467 RepID=K2GRX6_ENTNP|nr:Bax inhibitor, putative [Entamoeba nuttalli P19]EKE37698.1 Bax inhibitor, putative [Entamoeba nuttalli P19]|eukprot:XP_008859969.1 Bax inhibitor, putative [Entamoeba nuttalli P19]